MRLLDDDVLKKTIIFVVMENFSLPSPLFFCCSPFHLSEELNGIV